MFTNQLLHASTLTFLDTAYTHHCQYPAKLHALKRLFFVLRATLYRSSSVLSKNKLADLELSFREAALLRSHSSHASSPSVSFSTVWAGFGDVSAIYLLPRSRTCLHLELNGSFTSRARRASDYRFVKYHKSIVNM